MTCRGRVVTSIIVLMLAAGLIGLWHRFRGSRDALQTYCNVRLNDSRDEVQSRLGYPPQVAKEETVKPSESSGPLPAGSSILHDYYTDRRIDPVNAMPLNQEPKDFQYWSYPQGNGKELNAPDVQVQFSKEGRVVEISCTVPSRSIDGGCPPLIGISIGTTETQVLDKLSYPSASKLDHGAKILQYPGLGIELLLLKERVSGIALRSESIDSGRFSQFARRILPP